MQSPFLYDMGVSNAVPGPLDPRLPLDHTASAASSSAALALAGGEGAVPHFLDTRAHPLEWSAGQQGAPAGLRRQSWLAAPSAPLAHQQAPGAFQLAEPGTVGTQVYPLPLPSYDWQAHAPRPQVYTPYRLTPAEPALLPPAAPAPAQYGFRADAFAPYPNAVPIPPSYAQSPVYPQPSQPALQQYQYSPPTHDLSSALPIPPQLPPVPSPQTPLHTLASVAKATCDGSRDGSEHSSPGSNDGEAPPELSEPQRYSLRGPRSSIELPCPRESMSSQLPPLRHLSVGDLGAAGALGSDLSPSSEASGSSGTRKRTTSAPASGELPPPPAKKRKQPKDLANRKYVCTECDQRFARPSALATHVLTHTKEKPFVCCTCNRGFAVMSNLRRHCRVRSHVLAPEQESSARGRSGSGESTPRSAGASGSAAVPLAPDPGPPPLPIPPPLTL
ncbi:hypothetical protein Rhopal_000268-T1 [Rhodotorula paludigena]|uniref:C2H2-type domain-containing protein n=1 Tax=Rhodotorula paludigena TaxID=86838 RepID=A0AAV5G4S7_9BASI|nr:hypothetical protein Rhopal_000268-T1 [Rhodotorula paludigena]